MTEIHQFPYNKDNYGFLLHDPITDKTVAVDAGDHQAYLDALSERGWSLDEIWITHHHWDHTDGLVPLKEATGAKVFGPRERSKPIKGIDTYLDGGDHIEFAGQPVNIIHTPGHTLDMINFYLPQTGIIFTGDTLFTMGCGRLFEGTPAQMWESLEKLIALPDDTIIYGAHEYTLANAAFALSLEPDNEVLVARAKEVEELRAAGKPTVPTVLAKERLTNPFIRANDPLLCKALGMEGAQGATIFTEVRARKDSF